jgi:hypothetical protein
MSIRLTARFRPAVRALRQQLTSPERDLLDLISGAGELAWRVPDHDVNRRLVEGARDPRVRLAREFPFFRRRLGSADRRAGRRLAERLVSLLSAEPLDEETRSLRVLLGMAPAALAPDCVVPRQPMLRLAWTTVLRVFETLYPSGLVTLDPIPCVGPRRFAALWREAAGGLAVGRRASGRRPPDAGARLAVDRAFIRAVGRALGRDLAPGYVAKLLYYTKPGDYVWPHPDDPQFAVNVLIGLDAARAPGARRGSALLTYRSAGRAERHEIVAGTAVAFEASGLVHAREPLLEGERVVLLSILLRQRARSGTVRELESRSAARRVRNGVPLLPRRVPGAPRPTMKLVNDLRD